LWRQQHEIGDGHTPEQNLARMDVDVNNVNDQQPAL
jgi:hypothetical protein